MTDLSALIARLEAAEVGSRELGHDVLLALGWHREQIGNFYGPLYHWSSPDRSPHLIRGDEDSLPNPVLSLDAALALAERVHGEAHALDLLQDVVALHDPHGLAIREIPRLLCSFILRAKQGEG